MDWLFDLLCWYHLPGITLKSREGIQAFPQCISLVYQTLFQYHTSKQTSIKNTTWYWGHDLKAKKAWDNHALNKGFIKYTDTFKTKTPYKQTQIPQMVSFCVIFCYLQQTSWAQSIKKSCLNYFDWMLFMRVSVLWKLFFVFGRYIDNLICWDTVPCCNAFWYVFCAWNHWNETHQELIRVAFFCDQFMIKGAKEVPKYIWKCKSVTGTY